MPVVTRSKFHNNENFSNENLQKSPSRRNPLRRASEKLFIEGHFDEQLFLSPPPKKRSPENTPSKDIAYRLRKMGLEEEDESEPEPARKILCEIQQRGTRTPPVRQIRSHALRSRKLSSSRSPIASSSEKEKCESKKKKAGRRVLSFTTNDDELECLKEVQHCLHTSEIPERLPCRGTEFDKICSFIRTSIQIRSASQALYISGVTGTGKTATVLQAVKHIQNSKSDLDFNFVYINAMELVNPNQIFVQIYVELFKPRKKVSPKTARRKLSAIFQYYDKGRLPVVLVVDELDFLYTKRQDIIYDIFNWASNDESNICVIAIANTLDLPERIFIQKIRTIMGANRLLFQAYDHNEIASIINDRLRGSLSLSVDRDAVEFASRKVAAISGDLRKALDIMRRSAQIAINSENKRLTMKHVEQAIREASTTVGIEAVCSLSRHSVFILRAALAEQISSGLDEFLFRDLVKQYRLQCHTNAVLPVSDSSVYRNALEMCSTNMLIAAPGSDNLTRRFRLGSPVHEVQFALKQLKDRLMNGPK